MSDAIEFSASAVEVKRIRRWLAQHKCKSKDGVYYVFKQTAIGPMVKIVCP